MHSFRGKSICKIVTSLTSVPPKSVGNPDCNIIDKHCYPKVLNFFSDTPFNSGVSAGDQVNFTPRFLNRVI